MQRLAGQPGRAAWPSRRLHKRREKMMNRFANDARSRRRSSGVQPSSVIREVCPHSSVSSISSISSQLSAYAKSEAEGRPSHPKVWSPEKGFEQKNEIPIAFIRA